jgi:hypothetical protein
LSPNLGVRLSACIGRQLWRRTKALASTSFLGSRESSLGAGATGAPAINRRFEPDRCRPARRGRGRSAAPHAADDKRGFPTAQPVPAVGDARRARRARLDAGRMLAVQNRTERAPMPPVSKTLDQCIAKRPAYRDRLVINEATGRPYADDELSRGHGDLVTRIVGSTGAECFIPSPTIGAGSRS